MDEHSDLSVSNACLKFSMRYSSKRRSKPEALLWLFIVLCGFMSAVSRNMAATQVVTWTEGSAPQRSRPSSNQRCGCPGNPPCQTR
jgi:hypothetical protein